MITPLRSAILVISICLLMTGICAALEVVNISPANQSISNAANTTITIVFDEAIDPSDVDYSHFKVFGRWSGPAEVAFSISNDGKTIELIPFAPYFAGEWVSVSIVRTVRSLSGQNLSKPYAWNFWIATRFSFLNSFS